MASYGFCCIEKVEIRITYFFTFLYTLALGCFLHHADLKKVMFLDYLYICVALHSTCFVKKKHTETQKRMIEGWGRNHQLKNGFAIIDKNVVISCNHLLVWKQFGFPLVVHEPLSKENTNPLHSTPPVMQTCYLLTHDIAMFEEEM